MGRRRAAAAPEVRVDRGYARVWIGGRFQSLGPCPSGKPTAEHLARAARLWQDQLTGNLAPPPAADRRARSAPREPEPAPPPKAASSPPPPLEVVVRPALPGAGFVPLAAPEVEGITIAEVGLRYLDHCREYYRTPTGKVTSSVHGVEMALRALFPFADLPAAHFGAKALKTVQAAMVAQGRPRVGVNRIVKAIRRVFRWAVSEELVPPQIQLALESVQPLQKGRTPARELPKIGEVADEVVDATIPYLPATIAAMVQFQRWTGARPGEVCLVRPCDVDRSGDVWVYTPHRHKLSWREENIDRRITIGANGQQVLQPFLERPAKAYCFSPRESEAMRAKLRRADRRSPMTPSQRARKPKKNRRRPPSAKYVTDSYRRAIGRAVDLANEERKAAGKAALPHWAPNQLRHLRAGEVKEAMGIETASAVLGHMNLRTTEIYADRKLELAKEASRRLG